MQTEGKRFELKLVNTHAAGGKAEMHADDGSVFDLYVTKNPISGEIVYAYGVLRENNNKTEEGNDEA